MEIYLKWATQCHHLNQAQTFHTAINFPVYNLDEDFIIDTLLRSPMDSSPSQTEGFRCKVELPPLDALICADPTELLAIRRDLGSVYFYTLNRWQEAPTIENEEAVKQALRTYSEWICVKYDAGIRQNMLASISRVRQSSPVGEMVKLGLSGGGMATGLPVGIFIQLSHAVTTLYHYVRRHNKNKQLRPKERELEVSLPSSA